MQLQEDRISRIRASLYDDYKDGLLTSEEFVEMRDVYSKQLDDIRSELKSLEEDKNYREVEVKTSGVWNKAVMQFKNPREVTRELIEAVIDRIEVYDNEKIKITFKCMDEFERLGDEIKKRKEEVA